MQIIVYGLGKIGKEFIEDIDEIKEEADIEIVAVTDSYVQKEESDSRWNYIRPEQIADSQFDYIVVTPESYFDEIRASLFGYGIKEEKIKSIREFSGERGRYYCEICEKPILRWRHFYGERARARGQCPVCGSFHRHRFMYHVIKEYTHLLDGKEHSVLHFAPELFSEKIKRLCGADEYITADIEEGRADVVADITNLQFENQQFEYVICNHVMEHVANDKAAFRELKRVLKPDGMLIFSVPVNWDAATLENENIISKEDRIKYYGQEDHVRYYGKDVVEKLRALGFDVQVLFSNELVNEENIVKFGYPHDQYDDGAVFLCRIK
ncbi:methyltransferase domain-containing protein [Lachnospiraceae bacterium 48-42]